MEEFGYIKIVYVEQIQGCERFLYDLESGRWDIRKRDAIFVVSIIENSFKHKQGESPDGRPLRGKPLKLEPWEKFIIYNLLIFYKIGTNERRFKEAFIFIPRKNGKTIFISALAWALALLHRKSGSSVYVVGFVLKEAMKSFENWIYNLGNIWYPDKQAAIDDGWRILDNNMEYSISHDNFDGGSLKLEALAGNPDARTVSRSNTFLPESNPTVKGQPCGSLSTAYAPRNHPYTISGRRPEHQIPGIRTFRKG